jgi:hypothetical protein
MSWSTRPLNSFVYASGVTDVLLSGTTLANLGAQNAGAVIGAITLVGGPQLTPVVISGPFASFFAVTNGGFVPCNLIAAVDIPSGDYTNGITLSAS